MVVYKAYTNTLFLILSLRTFSSFFPLETLHVSTVSSPSPFPFIILLALFMAERSPQMMVQGT